MKFIADFHIHSHRSVATSGNAVPEYLAYWANLKGITVVGTGDFTHPGWVAELKEKLKPAEEGLFRLGESFKKSPPPGYDSQSTNDTRFVLTAEISCIYKKKGKVRKVHNLILAPDFEAVEKIQQALKRIGGNITSDGRPILGLDSRNLLEICLDASENIFFVPAHIWTPWFSVLGSKSGFDTVGECFDDLAGHIYAIETGLSSDPAMNWICSFLDTYTIISNSDAHSPEKLGREANIFDTELSYAAIIGAMKTGDPGRFLGTIEFFPQEGKYHFDGHRKCSVVWDPVETGKHDARCPVCKKPVTVGVMNRVAQLSDREDPLERKNRHPFYPSIPLKEILSEIYGAGPSSKKIDGVYRDVLKRIGSEFEVLLDAPVDKIQSVGYGVLAEGIRRMREGEVVIQEGYDGEYGRITAFKKGELALSSSQEQLFDAPASADTGRKKRALIHFDLHAYRRMKDSAHPEETASHKTSDAGISDDQKPGLNPEQQEAAEHFEGPALVIAGPGTGKTRVLTCRIAHLIRNRGVSPEHILAVTFTNKAAAEMRERLQVLCDDPAVSGKVTVATFHAFGYSVLKKHAGLLGRDRQFSVIDEEERAHVLQRIADAKGCTIKNVADAISAAKQALKTPQELSDTRTADAWLQYEDVLQEQNAFDLDDLIYQTCRIFKQHPAVCSRYRDACRWIMIDEYQDINFSQYHMITSICAQPAPNLYVIGDPDQAIYGFRGADIGFIRTFKDNYPAATLYTLTRSYRCSDRILRASGQVIRQGDGGGFLEGLDKGVKITIASHGTEKSEAEYIARLIEDMIGGTGFFSIDSKITKGEGAEAITSLSDFAVLFRLNRQSAALEKALQDHSVPYQTVDETPFFRREPVKTIIQMLRLSKNPRAVLLAEPAVATGVPRTIQTAAIIETIQKKSSVKSKIAAIIDLYSFNQDADRLALCKELLAISSEYGNNLEEFIAFTDLGQGVDTYKPDFEAVTLMSLHAAKGLEFNCVFIAGCEDGLIPYSLFGNQKSDPEEERRLLYVGMTRAKRYLFLSHAEKRFLFGREHSLKRSPFLDAIEKELIETATPRYKRKQKEENLQTSLFE